MSVSSANSSMSFLSASRHQVEKSIKTIACYTHNNANKKVAESDISDHITKFYKGSMPDLINISTQEAKKTERAARAFADGHGYHVVPGSYRSQTVITKISDFFKSIFLFRGFSKTAQITLVKDGYTNPQIISNFSHRDTHNRNKGGVGTIQIINGHKFAFISNHLDSNDTARRRAGMHNLLAEANYQAKDGGTKLEHIVMSGDFNTRNIHNNKVENKPLLSTEKFKETFDISKEDYTVTLPRVISNEICTYHKDESEELDTKKARADNHERRGGFLDGSILFSPQGTVPLELEIVETVVGEYGRSDHAQVSTLYKINSHKEVI